MLKMQLDEFDLGKSISIFKGAKGRDTQKHTSIILDLSIMTNSEEHI